MERRQILLKLEGLPVDTSFKDINRFFKDPNISKEDVNILRNESMKCVGIAYVRFSSKAEADFACRHAASSINGSYVTFKETSMGEMAATRAKIEGGSSAMDRRAPRAGHSFNSRLSDSREREDARRLPFSRFTSAPLNGPGRTRSRSRSPPHRPGARRGGGYPDHRPSEPYRHDSMERHDGRHFRPAHSPPCEVFHGRDDLMRAGSPPLRRRMDEDNHVFSRLSDSREDHKRRPERMAQHRRDDHMSEEEFAHHHRRRVMDPEPPLAPQRLVEERRMGRSVGAEQDSDERNRDRLSSGGSRGPVPPPPASRQKRPVPTAVAKMYELKVMGFPESFLYRDIQQALGPSVSVAHNGIDLDKTAQRPTAYVLVVGVNSYNAALEKDGYQLDRSHTLTVLPANRAKDTDSSGAKAPEDDLRDVLVKKRHRDGDKQRQGSPDASLRPSTKKVSGGSSGSSRRRDDEEPRSSNSSSNHHRSSRVEESRPSRREEDLGQKRDKGVSHRREEDSNRRLGTRDAERRGERDGGQRRDEETSRKQREKDDRREREREAERRERRVREEALDQERNMRLEEPGYIDKLWNSMGQESPRRKVRKSPTRTSPKHRYLERRLSYDRDERPSSHSKTDKPFMSTSPSRPHSRSGLASPPWDRPSSREDRSRSQFGLSKLESESYIPLSRRSFGSPEPLSSLDPPLNPLYGGGGGSGEVDSYEDRSRPMLTHPLSVPGRLGEGSLPPGYTAAAAAAAAQLLAGGPLPMNPYILQQQQQQQAAAMLGYTPQQGMVRALDPVSMGLLPGGVAPGALVAQQQKPVGVPMLRPPGVGYTTQTTTPLPFPPPATATFAGKAPLGSKLPSTVHIVSKPGGVVPRPSAPVVAKPGTVITSNSSALTLTQLGLGAGSRQGGHHMLRITGVPPTTTINDVIGFLQDHTLSFNDVRIQCTDMGQPTGKVFVTYHSYTQASEKVKALSGKLMKQAKVTLDVV